MHTHTVAVTANANISGMLVSKHLAGALFKS
jgi:hypothetical protein